MRFLDAIKIKKASIKKPFIKKFLQIFKEYKMQLNYFTWIANLGVVPLFLLDAFLFAPAAFFLFALLTFVTPVLETMINLLKIHKYNEYCFLSLLRAPKVAKFPQCVKRILAFCIVTGLIPTSLLASELQIPVGKTQFQRYSDLLSYSVKNPEILHVRFLKEKNLLAIKGLRPGKSEVLLNFKDQTNKPGKERLEIFVHQDLRDQQFLNLLGLSYVKLNQETVILGQLDSLANYQRLKHLSKTQKNWNLSLVTLNPQLEEVIWQKIHLELLIHRYYETKCDFLNIQLLCLEKTDLTTNEKFIKTLQEKWFIDFKDMPENSYTENLEVKLKLVQMEKQNGTDIHLGLDQLSSDLNDFFTMPLRSIIGKNQVLLNSQDINLDVLTEPRLNTLPNIENQFSIGSEIPFTIKNENGRNHVVFKFAGLLLKIKLVPHHDQFVVQYITELSKPEVMGESMAINGNKQQSHILIQLNKAQKLFEIEFIIESKEKSALPFFKDIPLLGKIFHSTSNRQSYKKIIGIIQITKAKT